MHSKADIQESTLSEHGPGSGESLGPEGGSAEGIQQKSEVGEHLAALPESGAQPGNRKAPHASSTSASSSQPSASSGSVARVVKRKAAGTGAKTSEVVSTSYDKDTIVQPVSDLTLDPGASPYFGPNNSNTATIEPLASLPNATKTISAPASKTVTVVASSGPVNATGATSPAPKQVVLKEEVVSEEVIRREVDPVTGKTKKTKVIVVRKVIKEYVRKKKPEANLESDKASEAATTPTAATPSVTTPSTPSATTPTVTPPPATQSASPLAAATPSYPESSQEASAVGHSPTATATTELVMPQPRKSVRTRTSPQNIEALSTVSELPTQVNAPPQAVAPEELPGTSSDTPASQSKVQQISPVKSTVIEETKGAAPAPYVRSVPTEETKDYVIIDEKISPASPGGTIEVSRVVETALVQQEVDDSEDATRTEPQLVAAADEEEEEVNELDVIEEDEDEDAIELPPPADYIENEIFARLGEEDKDRTYEELQNRWDEGDASICMVRGKTYMKDHVKVTAAPQAFKTLGTVVVGTDKPLRHAAATLTKLKTYLQEQSPYYPFFCIFNWQLPGKPAYSVVQVAGRTMPRGEDPAFDNLLDRFVASDDKFRDERIKFLCILQDAPSLVRTAMTRLAGNKPALIGNKLKCKHFTGPNYIEVDIDVGSSWIASMLNNVIYNNASSLALTMGFMIEGRSQAELPERLITWSRFIHVSPKQVSQNYFGALPEGEDHSAYYRRRYVQALAQGLDPTANNNFYAQQ